MREKRSGGAADLYGTWDTTNISAGGEGVQELVGRLSALLDRGNHRVTLRIPYSDAGVMDLLNREAAVTGLEYLDDCIKAEVTVPPEVFGKVKRYIPGYAEPKEDWED